MQTVFKHLSTLQACCSERTFHAKCKDVGCTSTPYLDNHQRTGQETRDDGLEFSDPVIKTL